MILHSGRGDGEEDEDDENGDFDADEDDLVDDDEVNCLQTCAGKKSVGTRVLCSV